MAQSLVSIEQLVSIRDGIRLDTGNSPKAWQIKERLSLLNPPIFLDESTIRGRFIEIGQPLGGGIGAGKASVEPVTVEHVQARIQELAKKAGVATAQEILQKHGISDYKTIPEGFDLSQLHEDIEVILTGKKPPAPPKPVSKAIELVKKVFTIPDHLKMHIPQASMFTGYIERPIDKRLALHYDTGKVPLTQGKQGTGKTYSHMFYAYKNQLPFYLFSAFEDFKLHKLFGDKTIQNGSVMFKEGLLTQAIQHPGVILIDEVNYISNENSVDFHAFLQNRELFVKDADNGNGKIYKLHEDCRIGFAQNPKSAKYIGGNIKPSNFLGRCTYLTYPEFSKLDLRKAIEAKFPNLITSDVNNFVEFYVGCCEAIESAAIPVDISIRQLNNVIDLYSHGMPLKEAIEDGLTSIMEAASQPKNKEAFMKIAQACWKDLTDRKIEEKVGNMK